MMIPSVGASDPCAAAAAIDRPSRAAGSDTGAATPDASLVAAGPDVVVTLGQGTPPGSSTYDASGRMSAPMTLDDLGANAPDSLAKTGESDDDDAATPTASTAAPDNAGDSVDTDVPAAA